MGAFGQSETDVIRIAASISPDSAALSNFTAEKYYSG